MSRTTEQEARVARVLAETLGVDVRPTRLNLGSWGRTDGYCSLASGWRLVVETENAQSHPSTNVAKLWPWLEEHPGEHVVLVHAFFAGDGAEPPSRAIENSRGRLARWMAAKMEAGLAGRFHYRRVVDLEPATLAELRSLIESLAVIKDATAGKRGIGS
jgi:hypothetical protein